ncbi:MAG TPA: hypothetical protein VGE16_05005 [Albitalea sp.]
MDMDIDKPSALLAVVVGLAASLVIDAGTGSRVVEAQEVTANKQAASGPTTRAGCPVTEPERHAAAVPAVPPPAGPTDRQVNSSGTGATGAAGTVSAQVPGDPCERPHPLLQQRQLPASVPATSAPGARPLR